MALRDDLIEQGVSHYLDDSLNVHEQPYEITDKVRLVAFQCGFEPLVCAVKSYLDVTLTEDEAIEIAEDYLREIGWLKRDDMEIYVA